MQRRTKIIATLGPATADRGVLQQLLAAGVNLVRINMSHGDHAQHTQLINTVRECAHEAQKEIGILVDLQGPKIRIARFKHNSVILKTGGSFSLNPNLAKDLGDNLEVGIDYKNLINDVHPGDLLLLDDGMIVLEVQNLDNNKINCKVNVGGKLSDHKGINRQGGGLSADALTAKDKQDIEFAAKIAADYVAVSFPRAANDLQVTRDLLIKAGSRASIIAKIERSEAVEAIDEIITASDGVMVARGDLGVEIGVAELPAVQKHIIARARALDKAVITATQMMESMIYNPIPTRAEVSDVANAVIDGTDAVMLSAETATGKYPIKVVSAMAASCLAAERQKTTQISKHRIECRFNRADEAIAMSAMYAANHLDVKAIVALTESGSTPLWMSRIRTGIPIYGISRHQGTRGKMTLYRGVYPIALDLVNFKHEEVTRMVLDKLLANGLVDSGDLVIITKGDIIGLDDGTNSMKIARV